METIKEEKKADLEQLLNSLIEKGWKPRGVKHKIFSVQKTPDNMIYFDGGFGLERCYDFRQLVSKESGLWQFVCKNKLYNRCVYVWLTSIEGFNDEFGDNDYQFRLIESSLKDENELEDFLLQNIKVGNED